MRFPNILALSLMLSVLVTQPGQAQPYYQTKRILDHIHHTDWKCHGNSTEVSCSHMKYCSWHHETCAVEKEEIIDDFIKASPIGSLALAATNSIILILRGVKL